MEIIRVHVIKERQAAHPVKNVSAPFLQETEHNIGERSALVFKLFLTWNDRDSFQSSENSECSQR